MQQVYVVRGLLWKGSTFLMVNSSIFTVTCDSRHVTVLFSGMLCQARENRVSPLRSPIALPLLNYY